MLFAMDSASLYRVTDSTGFAGDNPGTLTKYLAKRRSAR